MLVYVGLIVGFIFLVKGADLFVDGSSSMAGLLRIPPVIIGLTIVAMGTSAPEAAVSITAALNNNSDIALGNIIGSNIFNLLIVIGLSAIIKNVQSDMSIMKRDLPLSFIITAILFMLCVDGKINAAEGFILLGIMAIYLIAMIISSLKNRDIYAEDVKVISPFKSVVFILIGLVLIVFGGDLVVKSASSIATSLGLSQSFIGLTIVAAGTSLPELFTSVMAAKKGHSGLALGNAIGSNIFNIAFILGVSSVISPISISATTMTDIIILLVATVMIFAFCMTKRNMNRKEGIVSVSLYGAYTAFLIACL